MRSDTTPAIALTGVAKRFGRVVAVAGLDLEVDEGEFFSLLGPSGCGKTTTLRMLGGFEVPDSGSIFIRGEDVTFIPPNKRVTNMVFQNYELFPHMTVFANVAYGLKLGKVAKLETERRVGEILDIVGVGGLERRGVDQLSGGQKQRVALARALVNRPAVLLLDEPLSALDVKLRKRMQLELKAIQDTLGTTFVYVTHDQDEALLLSDRIGIMNGGKLLQVGTPQEIYERPIDSFVADFVGTMNAFVVVIDRIDGTTGTSDVPENQRLGYVVDPGARPGDSVRIGVRPERIAIWPVGSQQPTDVAVWLRGRVVDAMYMGSVTQFEVETGSVGMVVVSHVSDEVSRELKSGSQVVIGWPLDAAFAMEHLGSDRATG